MSFAEACRVLHLDPREASSDPNAVRSAYKKMALECRPDDTTTAKSNTTGKKSNSSSNKTSSSSSTRTRKSSRRSSGKSCARTTR